MNADEVEAISALRLAIARRILGSEDFPIRLGTAAYALLDSLKYILEEDR